LVVRARPASVTALRWRREISHAAQLRANQDEWVEEVAAWEPIDVYERYWTPFDDRYSFTPRFDPIDRPGITEPPDSVTLSLSPIFQAGSASEFAAGAAALNAEVLRAFVHSFDHDQRLVVLDWQHQSYWFRPHLQAVTDGTWPVTPFPNGDYYIFLTEDMTSGTFGHPWEQTVCVFGAALVDALVPSLETWLPVLRREGGPAERP
jgi:Protein of unknown function (DUF2716)